MRIALAYDCLFPHTLGGVERCYRALAEHLACEHEVTYLTRRQWSGPVCPDPPRGVRVIAVSGADDLYDGRGRRALLPPLRFGFGLLRYLARHRHELDVVHTCAFPFFSVLAAASMCRGRGPALVTDWYEVWDDTYWRSYAGPIVGRIGAAVQRHCVRRSKSSFVFSDLHAARLAAQGFRGRMIRTSGIFPAPVSTGELERRPLLVFAGRHVPEKRVASIPEVVAQARRSIPDLRAVIFGDGPDRPRVLEEVRRLGLDGVVDVPGIAPWEEVDRALRRAMCLLLPSRREGFGLVVAEALVRGTPAIVTRDPNSAAVELIEDGANGVIADDASVETLAAAVCRVYRSAPELSLGARRWSADHSAALSGEEYFVQLERMYELATGAAPLDASPLQPPPSWTARAAEIPTAD